MGLTCYAERETEGRDKNLRIPGLTGWEGRTCEKLIGLMNDAQVTITNKQISKNLHSIY